MRGGAAILLTVLALNAQAQEAGGAVPPAGGAPPAIAQDLLSMRDPFRRPAVTLGATRELSVLEMHSLSDFQVVGIMTGPNRIRAMVKAPDGKTHFVSENDKIGNRKGFIKKITPTGFVVQEHVVNVLGEEEITLTEKNIPNSEAK